MSLIKLIDFVVFVLHSCYGVKQSEYISKCAFLCVVLVNSAQIENASVPQAIWNIYDRDDDNRTNNYCEIWHSKWNRSSGAPQPHIWQ
jgi:hypothetical protein